ncbi:phosphate ABC transporter permease PstA [Nocardioides sp. TRM66260-LWL]|uniref:phosphate ABC transporter permease PstA n=1 Tax=Nocardioides sp. TRM66260-LWL TaxID=2874478 RepID=UPI001CC3E093|nr:phosphate ABC transporter permease PstA [Nocardioides sp. TRM66260-LWL]MBZ5734722.1 phosphate ABC transporter permease PstA [Nocardioides sp. TRM66260-LWL]
MSVDVNGRTGARRAEPLGTTHLPDLDAGLDLPEQPRRAVRAVRSSDVFALAGSAVAAVALTALLTTVVLPTSGVVSMVLIWYVSFLGLYALLVSQDEQRTVVVDRIATVVLSTAGVILFGVLVFVLSYTVSRGSSALTHANFFSQDMKDAGPLQGLEVGGMIHAAIGTLEQISIALTLTVPLGLVTAVFLNEFPSRFSKFVRTIVEAMTALPSIVAGLFIYATFILMLGRPKSGLAAALALSVMMLPIVIRASDVVLRLVPGPLKEASYALGTSRWKTVWHVVLPTARSGLTTAVILGTARGIGETSPVLLTAGFSATVNANPLEGPQVSLPLAIFEFVRSPQPAMIQRGFGTAVTLLALVLLLFIAARIIGGRAPGQETARMKRRRKAESAKDAARMAARLGTPVGVLVLVGGIVAGLALAPSAPAKAADAFVPISGAGSTWSQNALDQWRRNVNQYGMQVNYQGTGSSDGRNQFRNGTVDFAVSEIPYGLKDGGVVDTPPTRGFAYMPIVAGGTSFMYNLKIGGQRVTNLRLSGDVIAGIFTGNITQWNDPKIKADNPGLALPARQIIPVVRSDGSGTTAQFATWMSKEHAQVWNNYCATAGRPTPCGVTSFFPVVSGSKFVAQAGSLGVSGFVSQAQNEGTITYVEYSYALATNFPVVKVLNSAGYYVEPTANSVAVGLEGARIDKNLTQDLTGVYRNRDPRTYPLSSYSYMIVPTATTSSFTTAKGYTLGAFASYFLCEGQQQAPTLGYSPLPLNLVQAAFKQVARIPGAKVAKNPYAKCNNPTFGPGGTNLLAKNAPYPAKCDKQGPTQCLNGTGGAKVPTANTGGAPDPGNGTPSGGPGGGSGTTAGPGGSGGGTATTGTGGAPGTPVGSGAGTGGTGTTPGGVGSAPVVGAAVDPETGLPAGTTLASGAPVAGQSVNVASGAVGGQTLLLLLAGLVLVGAVVVPPLVGQYLGRRA